VGGLRNQSTYQFTIDPTESGSGGGGGGGGTSTEGLTPTKDFIITTLNLQTTMDFSLAKDSTKPRIKKFILTNKDLDPETVKISCKCSVGSI